eukprot:353510-Chlamydomonas_euryale.AAC.2
MVWTGSFSPKPVKNWFLECHKGRRYNTTVKRLVVKTTNTFVLLLTQSTYSKKRIYCAYAETFYGPPHGIQEERDELNRYGCGLSGCARLLEGKGVAAVLVGGTISPSTCPPRASDNPPPSPPINAVTCPSLPTPHSPFPSIPHPASLSTPFSVRASRRYMLPKPAVAVRNLVEIARYGHLCTTMCGMHHRRAGYPFGTLVDFAVDGGGYPVFCLSTLAIHSRCGRGAILDHKLKP